jgi:hypothetical protein
MNGGAKSCLYPLDSIEIVTGDDPWVLVGTGGIKLTHLNGSF